MLCTAKISLSPLHGEHLPGVLLFPSFSPGPATGSVLGEPQEAQLKETLW